MTATVLIIDDEPDIRSLLDLTLSRMGLETVLASDVSDALSALQSHHFDLCLTDMKLPDGSGMEIIQLVAAQYPDTPIAAITAHGSTDLAVSSLKAGAFDFLSKPVDIERLRALVSSAINLRQVQGKQHTEQTSASEQILGESESIVRLRKTIRKLARSQAPVFIYGESGTGKELVAKSIHQQGSRANAPFVPVNCGAIPRELVESEFFGHVKGAFTGAHNDKEGLFKAADGGTLFLDEVADLPLDMQVKLLRTIQEQRVRPVGAATEQTVDVRILSASHKDLAALVEAGTFRSDLYYRLNVIEVNTPALRDRADDIMLIANHILAKLSDNDPDVSLSKDAQETLLNYPFKGNIRELENMLERAYTLSDDDLITADDLTIEQKPAPANTDSSIDTDKLPTQVDDLENYLEEIERSVIESALAKNRYNKTATAEALGVTFRSLRYKLKKLGLK